MTKLENILFFTGINCHACELMKKRLKDNHYETTMISTANEEGMRIAIKYKVRSLPTFINFKTLDSIHGTTTINNLVTLNEKD